MSVNLSDIAILNFKGSDYSCIIIIISKNEAIQLLQNADLTKKVKNYNKLKVTKIFKSYMKIKKAIGKFQDLAIRKQKCHQDKISISIKDNEASNVYFDGLQRFQKH